MSDLLRIGAQGVAAYRGALSTISENVVNADTEGYSRRDVSLKDTALVGAATMSSRTGMVGGVRITGVSRAANAFLEADIRLAGAEASGARAVVRFLDLAETGLAGSNLSPALNDVYATGDALAGDPDGRMGRQAFLEAIDQAADAFNSAAGALGRARDAIHAEARSTVDAANADLAAIADVNRALLRASPGTNAHAALLDERDRRLASLSEKIGIDAQFDMRGTVTVRLAGGGSAPPLVSGTERALIGMTTASDGRVSLTLTSDGESEPIAARGGALGGLVEASVAVSDRQRALDAVAADFAAALNQWSAGGTDADGNPGSNLVSGTTAATLSAAVTDPAKVPAAANGAANGNMLLLSQRRDSDRIEDRAQAIADGLAQQLSSAKTRQDALDARLEQAQVARADIAGVDLDREAGELLRYQQAYDASSRVIQIARETLQTILSIF